MASKVYYSPFIPAFSSNGAPVPGAKLYFFYTGTSTAAPIYLDAGMTTPSANPVQANLAGRFPDIYLDEAITYRVRLTTSSGTPIGDDIDPYTPGQALKGDKGDPGAAGNVAATLLQLKAANTAGVTMLYDGATFNWTLGNFTSTVDDINVVKANSTPIATGAWVRQKASSIVTSDGLGGPLRAVTDAYQQTIRLTQFGFKGDGVTDDTAAWRAAIAYAGANKISDIIVPRGISLVTGQIANSANPLPPGLTFRGEAPGSTLSGYPNRLRYTGTGSCWDVAYPTGAPNFVGNWAWEAMTFECSDPAGTMFSFGDPLTHTPYDDPVADPYRYLMGIEFRRIVAYGAQGTGDFVRACKAFAINADAHSIVLNFRRAFWLKGCDNCRIECRMVGNNRAVMVEASGDFGNNNQIAVNFIGAPVASFGGEAGYAVYDTGSMTYIGRSLLLEGEGATAHLYLGGSATIVDSPQYGANSPLFEVGPAARDVVITSPRVPVANLAWAPIVNAPSSWVFGGSQTDYRVRVYDASLNIQSIIGAANDRGRILMVSGPDHGLGLLQANAPGVATTKGFIAPLVCSAANYWGDQGIGGQPIEGIVSDVGASGKRAIKLGTTSGSGFGLQAKIGGRISAAPYKVSIRNKLSGPITTGVFIFIVTKNGAFSQALTVNTTTSYNRPTPDSVDLSSWADGDMLAIQLYNSATGLSMWVDYVALTPVPD